MTAPDDDQFAELAARLSAEDPAFTRQFTSDTASPTDARRWMAGTGLVVAVLLVAGTLTGDIALALMAVPVSTTAALLAWAPRWRRTWQVADNDDPPPPRRTANS